jgi:serine/threonine protein kinase
MNYIHHLGVIHGDLKPENIMIVIDGRLTIKISDFGLSTLSDDHRLRRSLSVSQLCSHDEDGTDTYLAPDNQKTKASDVYSLGIVFVEVLSHFYTTMERMIVLKQLRQSQILPAVMEKDFPVESIFIRTMTSVSPLQRPGIEALQEYFDARESSTRMMCRDIVWGIIFDSIS